MTFLENYNYFLLNLILVTNTLSMITIQMDLRVLINIISRGKTRYILTF
jgi:hypothetical protein